MLILLLIGTASAFAQNPVIASKNEGSSKYNYYMMQGDYIIFYSLNKPDTILDGISFKNGNTITSKAELMNKKGNVIFLKDGECVDSKGNITNCDHLVKKLKRLEVNKQASD